MASGASVGLSTWNTKWEECAQAGVARCESLASLCETLKVLHLGGPLPGRRVLAMLNPAEAIKEIEKVLEQGSAAERQGAFMILGEWSGR